jgi:hypothetical protein
LRFISADSWGFLIFHRKLWVAVPFFCALGSGTAFTLFPTLVVPRDTTLMVGLGVRHTIGFIEKKLFTMKTVIALGVLNIEFRCVVGTIDCVVVVA